MSSLIFFRFTSGNNKLPPRLHSAVSSCFLALQRQRRQRQERRRIRFSPAPRSVLESRCALLILGFPSLSSSSNTSSSSSSAAPFTPQLLERIRRSASDLLLYLLLLRLFFLFFFFLLRCLLYLLPRRPGLECGDRKWCAGIGEDGPRRAPSPPYSMLDSVSAGRAERTEEEEEEEESG